VAAHTNIVSNARILMSIDRHPHTSTSDSAGPRSLHPKRLPPHLRAVLTAFLVAAWGAATFAQDADVLLQEFAEGPAKGQVFFLPYPKGKAYRIIQGPGGRFSHYGLDQYAWDFAMPVGEVVCATAGGRVVCVQQRFTTKSLEPAARTRANRIIIDHGRGVFSQYLHLKPNSALVREGDLVRRGQPLALSGDTGYSTRPHLHFQVQDALGRSMPIRFVDFQHGSPREGDECFSQNEQADDFAFAGDSPFPQDAFAPNGVQIGRLDLPGVRLSCDKIYHMTGRLSGTAQKAVVYLMRPEGGLPVWSQEFPVSAQRSFDVTFSFAGVRATVADWSTELHESNPFALAIAPVGDDGTYWSDISVPVFLR
jgi:murein DD-endopeptidase MepM/ murein hydrolase activator NlpD